MCVANLLEFLSQGYEEYHLQFPGNLNEMMRNKRENGDLMLTIIDVMSFENRSDAKCSWNFNF